MNDSQYPEKFTVSVLNHTDIFSVSSKETIGFDLALSRKEKGKASCNYRLRTAMKQSEKTASKITYVGHVVHLQGSGPYDHPVAQIAAHRNEAVITMEYLLNAEKAVISIGYPPNPRVRTALDA